ncbi:MAG: hypothetical protein R3C14_01990 [Caldilineaceae bacterium]
MHMIPIQVTDEGILIPKIYLKETQNLEIVVADEYILVRSQTVSAPAPVATKPNNGEQVMSRQRRFSFIGSGHTRNPKASVDAEIILEREIDQREGWSLDE